MQKHGLNAISRRSMLRNSSVGRSSMDRDCGQATPQVGNSGLVTLKMLLGPDACAPLSASRAHCAALARAAQPLDTCRPDSHPTTLPGMLSTCLAL